MQIIHNLLTKTKYSQPNGFCPNNQCIPPTSKPTEKEIKKYQFKKEMQILLDQVLGNQTNTF